jgi:hypothetical protein
LGGEGGGGDQRAPAKPERREQPKPPRRQPAESSTETVEKSTVTPLNAPVTPVPEPTPRLDGDDDASSSTGPYVIAGLGALAAALAAGFVWYRRRLP